MFESKLHRLICRIVSNDDLSAFLHLLLQQFSSCDDEITRFLGLYSHNNMFAVCANVLAHCGPNHHPPPPQKEIQISQKHHLKIRGFNLQ